jgi:hypothetical protein
MLLLPSHTLQWHCLLSLSIRMTLAGVVVPRVCMYNSICDQKTGADYQGQDAHVLCIYHLQVAQIYDRSNRNHISPVLILHCSASLAAAPFRRETCSKQPIPPDKQTETPGPPHFASGGTAALCPYGLLERFMRNFHQNLSRASRRGSFMLFFVCNLSIVWQLRLDVT